MASGLKMDRNYYINPADDPSDKVLKCYHYAKESYATAQSDSETLMQYAAANIQWSDDLIEQAIQNNKPTLTYNIIIPILMALQGNEQLARRRARIKPNYIEQTDIADIIQGRWNQLVDEQEIETKLQSVFFDALITKVGGWIQRDFCINDEGYLDFKYTVPNNMNILPDPALLQTDIELEHIRWLIKETYMSLDNIIAKYNLGYIPEKSESKYWWRSLNDIIKKFTDTFSTTKSEFYNKANDTYKVIEMQERVAEKAWICWDGQGYLKFNEDDFLKAKEINPYVHKIKEAESYKIKLTTVIPHFENMVVYNKESKIPTKNFDVFPMFSYAFNIQSNEGTSFVHLLKDLQDDLNKSNSQFRDLVTQMASGVRVLQGREPEALKELQERGNQPNLVVNVKGSQSKLYQLSPQQISPEINMQAEKAFVHAERISQVTPTIKGQTERSGESGILFQKKLEAAAASINPYFKNLSNLRKILAKDFIDHFPKIYSEENRPITIKTPKNIRQQVLINLNYAGQSFNNVANPSLYVELDEGEDNKTTREENFNQLLALSQLIAQINPAYVDVITLLEAAPITGVDKFIQHIQNTMQAQGEQQGQIAEIEQTKLQLQNLKTAKEIESIDDKTKIDAIKLAIEKSKNESANQKNKEVTNG